eukprot:360154-Chlamydomonas_euryale.AAC.4
MGQQSPANGLTSTGQQSLAAGLTGTGQQSQGTSLTGAGQQSPATGCALHCTTWAAPAAPNAGLCHASNPLELLVFQGSDIK